MSTPSRLIFLTEHSLNRIFTVSTIIQTLLIHVSRKASTLCYKLFHSRLPQNWKSVLLSAWRASNYLHKSTCLSTILNICSTLKTVLSPQTNCGALNKLGKYFLQLPWGSPSCSHSCCASTNTGHSAKPRFFLQNSLRSFLLDHLSLIFPTHQQITRGPPIALTATGEH